MNASVSECCIMMHFDKKPVSAKERKERRDQVSDQWKGNTASIDQQIRVTLATTTSATTATSLYFLNYG